jgi:hypothetical protein
MINIMWLKTTWNSSTTRGKVHVLYKPGYAVPCVGNFTGKKFLCKYVWISHRHMNALEMRYRDGKKTQVSYCMSPSYQQPKQVSVPGPPKAALGTCRNAVIQKFILLSACSAYPYILKIKAIVSSETSVTSTTLYRITSQNNYSSLSQLSSNGLTWNWM